MCLAIYLCNKAEMNGDLMPVQLKVASAHDVRDEVYNPALLSNKGCPIEWDSRFSRK